VAAVSTGAEGRPHKLKLAPVRGFRKRKIARGAPRWLAPGSEVVTDGLGCWRVLGEGTCTYRPVRTGSGPRGIVLSDKALCLGTRAVNYGSRSWARDIEGGRWRYEHGRPRSFRFAKIGNAWHVPEDNVAIVQSGTRDETWTHN